MDTGHETGSSTRDSQTESTTRDPRTESATRDPQSLPVVEKEDEQDNNNIETYPKLRIRAESDGFPVVLGHDQTSNGDGISSKNSSFDHFEVDPEILNRGMTDKSPEPIHSEENYDESSRNGSFKINSGVIARNHSSEHLESQPETVHDGGESHVEESRLPTLSLSDQDQPTSEDNKPMPPIIKMGSSSSSSSSSESSSGNGPFPGDLTDDFDPRSHGEDNPQARDTISEQNKPEEAETSSVSPVAASPGSDITLSGISPIQSPPVQVMQRSEEYDPNRIPSSIFERSSSDAQNDWSIASNESLFSIHVGTSTSFSREQAAFINETRKAEEAVPKQNEPFSFTPRHRSGETPESPNSPTAFPVAELAEADAVTASSPDVEPPKQNAEKVTEISTSPAQNPATESAKRAAEERRSTNQKRAPIVSWRSNSNSNFSDRSQNSTKSFAFPILNDEAKFEPSSVAVNKEEQQRQETVTTAAVVAPPKKVKRRWYRFLCCPWKGRCCSSCSSCSCRCFRCSKCCRC